MNSMNDSTDDDEQKQNQFISLIPSGYESPEFKTSFLHNFFMTPYQRQILRSQYSDCIQKVQINNKNYYVIIYDSEIQVVKLEGEQMHPIVTKVFCSFLIPLQKRKNPKIAQFLMLDRSNKLMFLEFDFNRENTPNFPTREEEELEIFGQFENEIFQQIFLTTDDELLLFISKQKLYILNLLDQTINQIQNPLNHQNHLNQSKPILECSQNKKHIIVAEGNKIIIITDYYILNTHTIKKNQQIINIKLSQNQLFIVTNNSIVKILNISNNTIQLQESDYLYIIDDIYYAHFEMENHNIIAILLINKSHEILFIDYSNQQNRESRPKKLDIEKIDTSFVVKYIEIEKITGQSIRFRIFYFTQQKQLGSIICQNI